ncbi:MAG: LysM peptidoglycan-binding domain-containing protein, partial [Chloroflexi bacterium]|nr:LysM peptidoglycan-binding domain-containing protein [Chloroflexota bacterium]
PEISTGNFVVPSFFRKPTTSRFLILLAMLCSLWLFAGKAAQAQTFLSNFRFTSITPVSISLAWDTDSSGPFTVILQTADSITIRSETATSASHTFYSLTPATRYRFVVQNQGVFLIQFVGPVRTTAVGQTFSVGAPGNLVATVEFEGCLRNGVSVERHRVTYSTNSGLTSLPSDGWLFSATAGDVVTIVMTRLTGDLRPVIRFYDPTVTGFIGRYDHGGGATAQVSSYSIPTTGIYTILSGTDGHSHNTEDGNFRLTLTWNSGTPGTVSNCVRLPSGGGSGGGSGGSGGGKSKPRVTQPKPSHEERADRDRQQLRDKHGIEFVAPDFVSPKKLDDNCGYRDELKRLPCSSAINLNDGDPHNQLINSDNPVDICFNKKNGFLAIIKTGVPETLEALDTCWDSDNNKTCARVASEGTVVLVDHSEPTSTDWFYKELGGRTISRSRCLSDPPPDIQVSPPVQQPVDQPAPVDPQPAKVAPPGKYCARPGDSCYRIAQNYFPDVQNPNAKLQKLQELNPGKCYSGYNLLIGEKLNVPLPPETETPSETTDTGIEIVRHGPDVTYTQLKNTDGAIDSATIGNQEVIDLGVIDAIEFAGTDIEEGVSVCFPEKGKVLISHSSDSTSYALWPSSATQDGKTCTVVNRHAKLVLVSDTDKSFYTYDQRELALLSRLPYLTTQVADSIMLRSLKVGCTNQLDLFKAHRLRFRSGQIDSEKFVSSTLGLIGGCFVSSAAGGVPGAEHVFAMKDALEVAEMADDFLVSIDKIEYLSDYIDRPAETGLELRLKQLYEKGVISRDEYLTAKIAKLNSEENVATYLRDRFVDLLETGIESLPIGDTVKQFFSGIVDQLKSDVADTFLKAIEDLVNHDLFPLVISLSPDDGFFEFKAHEDLIVSAMMAVAGEDSIDTVADLLTWTPVGPTEATFFLLGEGAVQYSFKWGKFKDQCRIFDKARNAIPVRTSPDVNSDSLGTLLIDHRVFANGVVMRDGEKWYQVTGYQSSHERGAVGLAPLIGGANAKFEPAYVKADWVEENGTCSDIDE